MCSKINRVYVLLLLVRISASIEAAEIQSATRNNDPQQQNLTEVFKNVLELYDHSFRPDHFGPPLRVPTSLYIAEIPSTSEVDMEFSMDLYLRQSWTDARLQLPDNIAANDYIPFGHELRQKIWTPHTYFPNEKHSVLHSATVPNLYFAWYPNGKIISSIHLSLTSSCPMNLVYFPMDYQICSIALESYVYDAKRVNFEWDSRNSMKFGKNALGQLQNYRLMSYRQTKWLREYSTGNFSSLMCELLLSRYLSYYVMQMYLPLALTVVISWFPFWMGGQTDWERIAIGVTTILTMTSLIRSIQQSSPKVSYITAMDVYTQTSFFMAFVSLLESTIVGYLCKRNVHASNVIDVIQSGHQGQIVKPSLIPSKKQLGFKEISTVLDHTCRVALPTIFVVFNIVYWATYLSASAVPTDSSWVKNLHEDSVYTEGNAN